VRRFYDDVIEAEVAKDKTVMPKVALAVAMKTLGEHRFDKETKELSGRVSSLKSTGKIKADGKRKSVMIG